MLSDSLVDSFAMRVSFQFHIVLLGNLLSFMRGRRKKEGGEGERGEREKGRESQCFCIPPPIS